VRPSRQLDWLLDDLVGRVTGVTKAVILSRDGLAVGSSDGMSREDAEYLCAARVGQHLGVAHRAPAGVG
jgi:predicted regulator of Ras-like GTPase activity (Roadblock/LC7/MglB family)